ncbi:MAG: hypothetical protein LC772_03205, partial [Chloroflexi bacterium]|nr:hypothetical protein [Chloroflexota bacterium]
LAHSYLDVSRPDRALAVELKQFEAEPDYAGYLRVKRAAGQSVDRWIDIRPRLTRLLENRGDWDALVRIYLAESDLRSARESLAKAAAMDLPARAASIYRELAEELIEARGRQRYQEAARYLEQAREIYYREGLEEDWDSYFQQLKRNSGRLPALLSELRSHGLE